MKEKILDVDATSNMKTNNILNLAIQYTIQNSCSLNIQLKHYLLWVGGLAKLECSETLQMPMTFGIGNDKITLELECVLTQYGSCHKITQECNFFSYSLLSTS